MERRGSNILLAESALGSLNVLLQGKEKKKTINEKQNPSPKQQNVHFFPKKELFLRDSFYRWKN